MPQGQEKPMYGAKGVNCSAIRGFGTIALSAQLLLPVAATRASDDATRFFGHIEAACSTKQACEALRNDLLDLDRCMTLEVRCKPAVQVLARLFGTSVRPGAPDFIVYFDQRSLGRGAFTRHQPRLVWQGKVTPHLYGVREIYAVILTEYRACLDAHVTTHYKSEPNPFAAVLAVLGSKQEAAAAKASERTSGVFHWYSLSGDPNEPLMWLAMARVGVDANSASRITVEYSQPVITGPEERAKGEGDSKCVVDRSESAKAGEQAPKKSEAPGGYHARIGAGTLGEGVVGVASPPDVDTGREPAASLADKYTGDFLAANGLFSNSPSNYGTISLALGISFRVKGTSVASGGSSQAFNGYAMAKFYLPGLRPEVRADADHPGRHFSVGAALGTGVKAPFDEMVAALSVGHVIGNAGFLAGGNYIAGAKDSTRGRKWCPFLGMDYTF